MEQRCAASSRRTDPDLLADAAERLSLVAGLVLGGPSCVDATRRASRRRLGPRRVAPLRVAAGPGGLDPPGGRSQKRPAPRGAWTPGFEETGGTVGAAGRPAAGAAGVRGGWDGRTAGMRTRGRATVTGTAGRTREEDRDATVGRSAAG